MSRVGQKPIDIPAGVNVSVAGGVVTVKGPKGQLTFTCQSDIVVTVDAGKVVIKRTLDSRAMKSCHGMTRSMISNMIAGVTKGYSKELEIQGVGFKAALQGRNLQLSLGYSHVIDYTVPAGVDITVDGGVKIVISGPDNQKVGDAAARIKSFYPAEPYKGKGVRFKGEYVRRKVGKSVA